MIFSFNIGTATKSINEYKKQLQTVKTIGKSVDDTIIQFCESGWSGKAKESFLRTHEEKKKRYKKLEDDLQTMISILEEAKQMALPLKARCEDFVNCIDRTGQGGPITSDDEGLIFLDDSGQMSINNHVNNCVDDHYVKLNSNFNEIKDILGSLEFTTFGIEDDVDTLLTSVKNQTESLTDFDESFNTYCAGVKNMESYISSRFAQITKASEESFKDSYVITPSGDIDKNNVNDVMLKNESGFTIKTLGTNANISNDMNLEKLAYEVDNDIDTSEDTTINSVGDDDLSKINITTTDGAAVTYDNPDLDEVASNDEDIEDDSIDDVNDQDLIDADENVSPIKTQTTDDAAAKYIGDLSSEDYDDQSNWIDDLKDDARDFIIGAGYKLADNLTYGAAPSAVGMDDDNTPQTTAGEIGKVAGDILSLVGRGAEGAAAGGAEIGGFALDLSGAGILLGGVELNAAGVAIAADSAAGIAKASNSLADDTLNLIKGNGEGGNYNFPKSKSDIKKVFGVSANTYHKEIKPIILKQIKQDSVYGKEFRKMGDNPDIGINSLGNVVIKDVKTGKTLETNWSFESFKP